MTNAKTSSLTGLKQRRIIGKVAFYVLGLLMAIIVCIPFYWMIITSLKGRGAIMSIPVEWIPKEPTLDAYKKLFAMPEFVGSIFNSFYVSVLCTAVRLLCAAILFSRTEKVKINDLVVRFGTCRRTIRYDVEILSLTYQIGSTPGRHGGIYIDSPIHSQPRYLTPEEAAALLHMLSYIQEEDKPYLKSILRDLARIDRL